MTNLPSLSGKFTSFVEQFISSQVFVSSSTPIGVTFLALRLLELAFGAGIWSSAFFFLSGYLGIITARNKNTCWIIITMIAGIFSAIISGILIILSAFALSVGMCSINSRFSYCDHGVFVGMNVAQS